MCFIFQRYHKKLLLITLKISWKIESSGIYLLEDFLNRKVEFSLAPIPVECANTAPSLLLTTAKAASICLL